MPPARVDVIFVESGGGHHSAALALQESIRRTCMDWDLRLVSVQELLDDIDVIRKASGAPSQEIYNIILRRGWTRGSAWMIPAMHGLIRIFHRAQVRVLERYWAERRPDLVVSLIPHFNRAFKESLDRACPAAPLVTILTDIADYPPHFWIERQDQFVICGSEKAEDQARSLGIAANRLLRASGMIVHPRFYERPAIDRRAERRRLGLDPDLPLGLAQFGGEGSLEMVEIARQLNREDRGTQLILLCGRHEQARRELEAMPRRIPMRIEGFTREVPFHMDLADFFIGKPGPGAISEAIVKGLPILTRRDRGTLAHEAYNCEWIVEQDIGVVIRAGESWADGVRRMLDDANQARFRRQVARIENRAVFEIPPMLERILTARAVGRAARQRALAPV